MPVIVPILVGLAVGAIIGGVNGLGIAYAGFPAFIMTLATMITVRGLGLVITNGRPIFNFDNRIYRLV